jgi:hypothetical protein
VKDAINLMDLTGRTADLFVAQEVHEEQRFLRLVLRSAAWQTGELRTEFEEPFETLRCSNRLAFKETEGEAIGNAEIRELAPLRRYF